MLTTNDVAGVYDTIMNIPGMNDQVKISLKLSRKNILLLGNVIERELQIKKVLSLQQANVVLALIL